MEFSSSKAEAAFVLRHLDPRGAYKICVEAGSRPDGRTLLQHRDVTLYTDGLRRVYTSVSHDKLSDKGPKQKSFGSSDGSLSLEAAIIPIKADDVISSAYAKIGGTTAICAINVLVGEPSKTYPLQGDVEIDVMFPNICSADCLQQRAKTEESDEIEKILDDIIKYGTIFDKKQLLIEEGKSAFRLNATITFLSVDGNTSAVAVHAFLATLMATSLPRAVAVNDKIAIDTEVVTQLMVAKDIIPISTCLYSDNGIFQIIVDPTRYEEEVVGNSALCLVDKDGNVIHFSMVSDPVCYHETKLILITTLYVCTEIVVEAVPTGGYQRYTGRQ